MFVCRFVFNLVTLSKRLLGLLVQSTLQYLCYIFTLFGNCLGSAGFLSLPSVNNTFYKLAQ